MLQLEFLISRIYFKLLTTKLFEFENSHYQHMSPWQSTCITHRNMQISFRKFI